MTNSSAYLSKIKSQVTGRAFKVQNSKNSLATDSANRGVAACGPLNYTEIVYTIELCRLQKLYQPYPRCIPASPIIPVPHSYIINGGNIAIANGGLAGTVPTNSANVLNGGTSTRGGSVVLNGGNMQIILNGGTPTSTPPITLNGGSPTI
jgi:hypothetical protein